MNSVLGLIKGLLPDRAMSLPVLAGPFRGARIHLNPRYSLRKVFGIYEHELNPWLEKALARVDRVLDVGANDGYFSIGCAASLRRQGRGGEIIGFEPVEALCRQLEQSAAPYQSETLRIRIVNSLVGSRLAPGETTLDAVEWVQDRAAKRSRTLIKIDVEGAEEAVLDGAASYLRAGNLFVIEVHRAAFLDSIPARFAARGLILHRIDQRPYPLLGRETRDVGNWWLVSDADALESPA